MNGEPLEFVDANVLVFAFDTSAGAKQATAERLITRLWKTGTGCLSVQVLQEFYATATKKVAKPLTLDAAAERIREYAAWRVFAPTADDVVAAIGVQREARIGFWDAMVVHAAAEIGCSVIWTEDLNDGQTLRGVRVRNPFVVQSEP
jgi:predicted nucleic acid-binding protein